MSEKPKRRWFRFSLKAMLVVMTVLCVGGGYVAHELKKVREQKASLEALRNLGASFSDQGEVSAPFAAMRLLLGDETQGKVDGVLLHNASYVDSRAIDPGLAHLASVQGLTTLWLDNTQVTDSGLVHLSKLHGLTELSACNTRITDAGLVHLTNLKALTTLWLTQSPLTDAGLVLLAGLTRLENLSLGGTQVTDAGLVHLTGLKKLEFLNLDNTQVTDVGVARLQKALPNCAIVH